MRHFISLMFLLILVTTPLLAQEQQYPRVEKVTVKDRLFHGNIDKYPITMYLSFHQYSNFHSGVYSVEGWYFYDRIKKKIPLSGIYSDRELVLYNFSDTAKSNEILYFREMKSNHWEDMDYYKNLRNYNEKLVISDSAGYWLHQGKKLEISLLQDDWSIYKNYEFLHLDANTTFDLHHIGAWTWNFELTAHTAGKCILSYEYDSRQYVMGMCGAGIEKGFLLLQFDKNNKLIQYEIFELESCNEFIHPESHKKVNNHTTMYYIHNSANETSHELTVDLEKVSIAKKEIK